MQRHPTSWPAIVAGIDFFAGTVRQVLQSALAASRQWPRADVHFLTMAGNGRSPRKHDEARAVGLALMHLRRCVTELLALEEPARWQHARLFLHARCGSPGEEILNLCNETRADLLVLGKVPLAEAGMICEDVIEFVLRQSACPALVIQPKQYDAPALVSYVRHCPACELARGRSAGAQWFCDTHRDEKQRSVTRLDAVWSA